MRKLHLPVLALLLFLATAISVYASVDLESFTGVWEQDPDKVVLTFATGSEINHAAFNVWRSDTNIAPTEVSTATATLLTDEVIVAETPCNVNGNTYTYDDTTVDPEADGYYYYLESIACFDGDSTFYGALDSEGGLLVSNPGTGGEGSRTFLPLIRVQ